MPATKHSDDREHVSGNKEAHVTSARESGRRACQKALSSAAEFKSLQESALSGHWK